MKEYILCSAIWYKDIEQKVVEGLNWKKDKQYLYLPKNLDRGVVFCGFRHPHCMYSMIYCLGKRSVEPEIGESEQGFLTSQNRFVDREEAAQIAFISEQIPTQKYTLYSEDLW